MTKINPLQELKQSIGIMAEIGLMYFRNVIAAGGTPDEAERLTKCFLLSMMQYGNKTAEGENNE